MSPAERRQELLEVLCLRRHDTYDNLANEFNVSKMTIRRDIAVLMCSYPVETVHGGRHGGVRVADGYYLNHSRKSLSQKQTALLRRLRDQSVGDDRDTINSILVQFAPCPSKRSHKGTSDTWVAVRRWPRRRRGMRRKIPYRRIKGGCWGSGLGSL